jgi:hypothetical protein
VHVADALINGGLGPDAIACLTAIGLRDKLAGWQQMAEEAMPGSVPM